jgi:hypothetical protein
MKLGSDFNAKNSSTSRVSKSCVYCCGKVASLFCHGCVFSCVYCCGKVASLWFLMLIFSLNRVLLVLVGVPFRDWCAMRGHPRDPNHN